MLGVCLMPNEWVGDLVTDVRVTQGGSGIGSRSRSRGVDDGVWLRVARALLCATAASAVAEVVAGAA